MNSPRTCFPTDDPYVVTPGWGAHWWKACALAALGKREQALTEVERHRRGAEPRMVALPARRRLLSGLARRTALPEGNRSSASAPRCDSRTAACDTRKTGFKMDDL